jgi:homogentisate 1,2-dioxygenase
MERVWGVVTTFNRVAAALKVDTHLMVVSMKGTNMECGFMRANLRRSLRVRNLQGEQDWPLTRSDQLTIMVESSRLFLFTEYARKGCGVIDEHGTDYKVWEALPVSLAK